MKKKLCFMMVFFILANAMPVITRASGPISENDAGYYDINFYVKENGDLWGYGFNKFGQIGDGTTNYCVKPKKILTNVASVALGSYQTFAVKTNGEVWSWGYNRLGALGDGTTIDRFTPKKVLSDVKSLDVSGNNFAAALKKNGDVYVWGNNDRGRAGNGSYKSVLSPKKVISKVKKISVGSDHVLALKMDGSLWCWGFNVNGQIGNGTTKDALYPVKIMNNVKDILAVHNSSLALTTSSKLFFWGQHPAYGGEDIVKAKKIASGVESFSYELHCPLLILKKEGKLWAMDEELNSTYIMKGVKQISCQTAVDKKNNLYIFWIRWGVEYDKILNNVMHSNGDYALTHKGNLYKINKPAIDRFEVKKIASKVKNFGRKN